MHQGRNLSYELTSATTWSVTWRATLVAHTGGMAAARASGMCSHIVDAEKGMTFCHLCEREQPPSPRALDSPGRNEREGKPPAACRRTPG